MRKVAVSNMISLDGYIAAPGGDLSWHVVNNEFHGYAEAMLEAAGTLIFGRVTYELMAGYWPQEHVKTTDAFVAAKMNGLEKIVFSASLDRADWENTTLLRGDVEKNIEALKQLDGKDIVILGSGTIVSALTEAGLIDEYRLFICPVLLGGGVQQFTGHPHRKNLLLCDFKKMDDGLIMLCYQPIK